MSYESYKARIGSYGGNAQESMSNITKHSQRQMILNSPTRKTVRVNDNVDAQYCIVSDIKTYLERSFLFLPDFIINTGDYIHYKDYTYLVTDSKDSDEFPEGITKLCNAIFPLSGTVTKIQTGINEYDEPTYSYTDSEPTLLPCVAEYTIHSDKTIEAINLPEGQILITIPYTEHEQIADGEEFTVYNTKYQIIGVDFTKSNIANKVGIIKIKGKKV